MEERLDETLNGYRDAAQQLGEMQVSESFDDEIPAEVQWALVRMIAAMALNERLEECEAFLSEETPEEVAEAYFEAQEQIARVLDGAFAAVDAYTAASGDMEERVEALSVNTEASGLADYLLKLYKCESIIRMAYRSVQRYPIYGPPDQMIRMEEDEEEVVTDQERLIMDKMGVDICALQEIRARLICDVQRIMEETHS